MNIKQQIREKEAELLKLKKQLESTDPTERIKTFEDACEDQGVDPQYPKFKYTISNSDEKVDNSGPAFERLKVIRNALLGDNKLEWGSNTGYKYFPWFDLSKKPGSGFFRSVYRWDDDRYSYVSSRLALNSSTLAIYFGSKFEDIWYEYLIEHKNK